MAGEISIALLGAGSFAQKQYLPVLSKLSSSVLLKALWSRSQASAEAAVSLVKQQFPLVEPKWGAEGLDEILANDAIQGVAIAVAPQVQWDVVLQALDAGKHVLQEKPVALSTREAQEHIAHYKGLAMKKTKQPIWAVGENYRFESGLLEASRFVKDIGEMVSVEITVQSPMNSSRPSFFSAWRRNIEGGYVLDSGVHFVAALRMLTASEVKNVVSITRHVDKSLPAPDNLSALFELDSGCPGVISVSFSCISKKMIWKIVGSKGTVEVEQTASAGQQGFMVSKCKATGDVDQTFYPSSGVENELIAFLRDMNEEGEADERSSTREAYRDVAVVEALLNSKGKLTEVQYDI